jgi:hypothetical protein
VGFGGQRERLGRTLQDQNRRRKPPTEGRKMNVHERLDFTSTIEQLYPSTTWPHGAIREEYQQRILSLDYERCKTALHTLRSTLTKCKNFATAHSTFLRIYAKNQASNDAPAVQSDCYYVHYDETYLDRTGTMEDGTSYPIEGYYYNGDRSRPMPIPVVSGPFNSENAAKAFAFSRNGQVRDARAKKKVSA